MPREEKFLEAAADGNVAGVTRLLTPEPRVNINATDKEVLNTNTAVLIYICIHVLAAIGMDRADAS
jgi:hypothetical protein